MPKKVATKKSTKTTAASKAATAESSVTAKPKVAVTPAATTVTEVAQPQSHTASSAPVFSSPSQLLKTSWELLKKQWIRLSLLSLLFVLLGSAIFLAVLFLFFAGAGLILGSSLGELFSSFGQVLSQHAAALISWTVLVAVLYSVVSMALGLTLQAGNLLLLADESEPAAQLGTVFKRALKMWAPLLGGSVLLGLIVVGGFGLFVIPGIIFSIFFMFWWYEIVLFGSSVRVALKNSMRIVKQQFGALFERWLLAMGLGILWSLVWYVVMGILSALPILAPFAWVGMQFVAMLFTWFMMAYWLKVYQEARAVSDLQRPASMGWIAGIAVAGWISILVTTVLLYRLAVVVAPLIGAGLKQAQEEAAKEQLLQRDSMLPDDEMMQLRDFDFMYDSDQSQQTQQDMRDLEKALNQELNLN